MENLTPETRLEYYLDKIATNGGGGDTGDCKVFIVNIDLDHSTADKTASEIEDALSDGKMICARLISSNVIQNQISTMENDDGTYAFLVTGVVSDEVRTTAYIIDTNGDVYIATNTYPPTSPS